MFLLNLKAYPGHLGPAAVRMAKLLEALGKETGVAVAIAPPVPDLARVADAVKMPVLAQHVDPATRGLGPAMYRSSRSRRPAREEAS